MTLLPFPRRWLLGPEKGAYRRELVTAAADRNRWSAVWRDVAEGVGLTRTVSVAAGETIIVPPLVSVSSAAPTVLVVKCLPGQLTADVQAVADRLAPALGAVKLRVTGLSDGVHCRLELLDRDPLDATFWHTLPALATITDPAILGLAEDGVVVSHPLAEPAHILVQGQNGSGKSRFTYGLLSQCALAEDVLVTGSDITGLLLGAPWDGTRHREHQAAGTANLEAHAATLERLVGDMDKRLCDMPRGVDKLDPTPETPLVFVVLEEFPGLLRAAAGQPKPARGERSVSDRIKGATLRLLSEGRKVAFRVLMLAQRAEAEATGGGYAREQFALAVSFRVPADSLVMAHGDDARELGATHRIAEPGIAVVSAAGRPITRMRAPWFESYSAYCAAVGGEQ